MGDGQVGGGSFMLRFGWGDRGWLSYFFYYLFCFCAVVNCSSMTGTTYTEPRAKRGSDKINMWKQGRNTQKKASRIVQPGLTYGYQHLER